MAELGDGKGDARIDIESPGDDTHQRLYLRLKILLIQDVDPPTIRAYLRDYIAVYETAPQE